MAILKSKLMILILAGVVLAGVVWYSFMRDKSTQLLQTQDLTVSTGADSDVVNVLLQLRAVSLSGTIFTDPAFQSLQDFGSQIVPEPVGRQNPFAPLGSAAAAVSTSTPAAQGPAQAKPASAR